MPEPIRVTVQFDTNGRAVLRQVETDLRGLSNRLAAFTQGPRSPTVFRQLQTDSTNLANHMRTQFSGAIHSMERLFQGVTRAAFSFGAVGLAAITAGVFSVSRAVKELAATFVKINEQFRGLEITLRSAFRSAGIAKDLREELVKITAVSPVPFQGLAEFVRSAAVQPFSRGQLATQATAGTLGDPQGFLRSSTRLVEQMLTFRPDKQVEDVIFALREAASGEFRSLVRRFDIPLRAIAAGSGTTPAQLKADPGATDAALKRFFGAIITPQAVQELLRQPSVLIKQIVEQLVDIPLLRIGEAGLFKQFSDFLNGIFSRVQEFVASSIKPFADNVSKRLQTVFAGLIKVGDELLEDLLSNFGVSKAAQPGATQIERLAIAIEGAVVKVSAALPELITQVAAAFKVVADFTTKIARLLFNFAQHFLKTFNTSPILAAMEVLFLIKLPGLIISGLSKALTFVSNKTAPVFATAVANARAANTGPQLPAGVTFAPGPPRGAAPFVNPSGTPGAFVNVPVSPLATPVSFTRRGQPIYATPGGGTSFARPNVVFTPQTVPLQITQQPGFFTGGQGQFQARNAAGRFLPAQQVPIPSGLARGAAVAGAGALAIGSSLAVTAGVTVLLTGILAGINELVKLTAERNAVDEAFREQQRGALAPRAIEAITGGFGISEQAEQKRAEENRLKEIVEAQGRQNAAFRQQQRFIGGAGGIAPEAFLANLPQTPGAIAAKGLERARSVALQFPEGSEQRVAETKRLDRLEAELKAARQQEERGLFGGFVDLFRKAPPEVKSSQAILAEIANPLKDSVKELADSLRTPIPVIGNFEDEILRARDNLQILAEAQSIQPQPKPLVETVTAGYLSTQLEARLQERAGVIGLLERRRTVPVETLGQVFTPESKAEDLDVAGLRLNTEIGKIRAALRQALIDAGVPLSELSKRITAQSRARLNDFAAEANRVSTLFGLVADQFPKSLALIGDRLTAARINQIPENLKTIIQTFEDAGLELVSPFEKAVQGLDALKGQQKETRQTLEFINQVQQRLREQQQPLPASERLRLEQEGAALPARSFNVPGQGRFVHEPELQTFIPLAEAQDRNKARQLVNAFYTETEQKTAQAFLERLAGDLEQFGDEIVVFAEKSQPASQVVTFLRAEAKKTGAGAVQRNLVGEAIRTLAGNFRDGLDTGIETLVATAVTQLAPALDKSDPESGQFLITKFGELFDKVSGPLAEHRKEILEALFSSIEDTTQQGLDAVKENVRATTQRLKGFEKIEELVGKTSATQGGRVISDFLQGLLRNYRSTIKIGEQKVQNAVVQEARQSFFSGLGDLQSFIQTPGGAFTQRRADQVGAALQSPITGFQSPVTQAELKTLALPSEGDEHLDNLIAKYELLIERGDEWAESLHKQALAAAASGKASVEDISKLEAASLRMLEMAEQAQKALKDLTGITPFQSLADGFSAAVKRMQVEAYNFRDVGVAIAEGFKTGFGNAFASFVTGAQTASEAFRQFGVNFLKTLAEIASQKLAAQIFGYLLSFAISSTPSTPTSVSAGGGAGTHGLQSLGGGGVGLAEGGMIRGGSGNRDDVPILAMGGEAILTKEAVKRLGGAPAIDAINKNQSLERATMPAVAEKARTQPMSAPPQKNALYAILERSTPGLAKPIQQDLTKFIIAGHEKTKTDNYRHTEVQKFAQGGMVEKSGYYRHTELQKFAQGGMVEKSEKYKHTEVQKYSKGGTVEKETDKQSLVDRQTSSVHKTIERYAEGGMIKGGSHTRDDKMVMVMGGEAVLNQKAVATIGEAGVHALNKGEVKGYAGGGIVEQANANNRVNFGEGRFGAGAPVNVTTNISLGQSGDVASRVNDDETDRNREEAIRTFNEELEGKVLEVVNKHNKPGGALWRAAR